MDLEQFKQDYPSAVIQGKTVTLSESDYLQLLKEIGTAAPENVLSFFYRGYAIEKESANTKQKS
jgi:hypothetical protein